MNFEKYSLSFTAGGLLYSESVKLASQYLEAKDWDKVYTLTIESNLLQAKAINSLKRISLEVLSRLKMLSFDELEYFVDATYQDQLYFLWVVICRRYSFIGDFAKEVIRERYLVRQLNVSHDDFSVFYLQKTEFHPELETISEGTKGKIRQVLFKTSKDVGILSKKNEILTPQFSQSFLNFITSNNLKELKYFPIYDSYVDSILEKK